MESFGHKPVISSQSKLDFYSKTCLTKVVRYSSEQVRNQLNVLCNIGMSNLVELKTIFNILKRWKTTSKELYLNSR